MRRVFVVVVLAAAVVALALAPCLAQDVSSGAIHGTVFDPAIRRIAGARVALVNSATGFRYEQPTNGQGQFAFELLPPGDYTARVTAEGMSPQISKPLHVDIGGVTDIAFQMTLAAARESVTVSAEPKAVETEPRGLSSVIDERAILNLPLNGRRFTDLALPTPNSIFLNQTNQYAQAAQYPNPLISCAPLATSCAVPASLLQFARSDISPSRTTFALRKCTRSAHPWNTRSRTAWSQRFPIPSSADKI
jgi:hypothetical protein